VNEAPGTDADRLARARHTIEEQTAEIENLRGALIEQSLIQRLREAVQLAVTTGVIAAPTTQTQLVELIVDVAVRVIGAGAASLFLLDETTQELVMQYPVGPKAPEIQQLRVPLGHGIAGLVAVNGQPMAVSDARADPRHAADIAEQIGYAPQSILCVPLVHHDEVTGVLEVFDKEGATGFSSDDMEILSLFAELAAIAIEQSRNYGNLGAFIGEVLGSLTPATADAAPAIRQSVQTLATNLEGGPAYQRALQIARLVQDIGRFGDDELRVCQTMLQGFADYLRKRPSPSDTPWGRV
jgi:signal transduction protein with GAF and PtsI domain